MPRHSEEAEAPLIVANIPAAGRQNALALAVAALLMVAAATVAPFAGIQLGRVDAFIPVLQTTLGIADLVTAALLFTQFSIQPHRALLAVASAYIFSGSYAFLQTLAFPGGYAPNGLIGDGSNSASWLYVLWHTMFPAGLLVYALTKDLAGKPSDRSVRSDILITLAAVFVVIGLSTWIVTAKTEYIPVFYTSDINVQTRLGNRANFLLWLWGATVLTVLLVRRRTALDLWLAVTLLACMPNFLVAMIGSSVRFTVGWYAARGFVLFSSCILLTVLIIETMFLYSRLASAISLQRRERTNRLLSVDAVTGAIAHELNSPLGAITLNVDTALSLLHSNPGRPEEIEDILSDIGNDSKRASAILASIRELTVKRTDQDAQTSADDAARLALKLLDHDLQISGIKVSTQLHGNLPLARISATTLQQILLNLIRNAIDAMSSSAPGRRRLTLATRLEGSTVVITVEDTGCGIPAADQERIFDPFFSSKPDGMGLGLSISSTLLAQSQGELRLVHSDPRGSIFQVWIRTRE
ncbi:MASE4 domain-containing protein [Bradyrhizobium yuanmingense]|uniref:MASE4 domain-containing protein n=1 Tax=Bradyrhizobium yuanmingense TaxID=108015 RepID=UPI001FD3FC77|nr:MASE4 domain-containing protein [Bradyrhizobium yuanmingense]